MKNTFAATQRVAVSRNGDWALLGGKSSGMPFPVDASSKPDPATARLMAASVVYEFWTKSPGAFYRISPEDRGIDSSDAEECYKELSEHLAVANRNLTALSCLVQGFSKARALHPNCSGRISNYSFLAPWSPSFDNFGKNTVSVTVVENSDGPGTPPAAVTWGLKPAAGKGDVSGSLVSGLEKSLGRSPDALDLEQALSRGVSPCDMEYGGRVMASGVHPVAATACGDEMRVSSWGLPSSVVGLRDVREMLSGDPCFVERFVEQGLTDRVWARIDGHFGVECPVMGHVFEHGDSCFEGFAMSGKGFIHLGTVHENDQGMAYANVLVVSFHEDGTYSSRTAKSALGSRDEIADRIREKRDSLEASYFETVSWTGLESGISRSYDMRAMDFWSSEKFWNPVLSGSKANPMDARMFVPDDLRSGGAGHSLAGLLAKALMGSVLSAPEEA